MSGFEMLRSDTSIYITSSREECKYGSDKIVLCILDSAEKAKRRTQNHLIHLVLFAATQFSHQKQANARCNASRSLPAHPYQQAMQVYRVDVKQSKTATKIAEYRHRSSSTACVANINKKVAVSETPLRSRTRSA